MKVYLVFDVSHSFGDILKGVYKNEEDAEQFIKESDSHHGARLTGKYTIKEEDVIE